MAYFGYIYITENLINGKKYIGKRSKPERDINYLGSGKYLKRAINKYGKENFKSTVLEWCNTQEELNEKERYYIKLYNAQKSSDYYNISEGGDWGDVSKGMTQEQYKSWGEKIRQHHLGTKHSEETKKRQSQARLGITYSEETIEKMRIANSGSNNPNYGKKQTKTHYDAMQKFNKKVVVKFPNEDIKHFNSVKECREYMKSNYNISDFLVKKLLREDIPLCLPDREKNHYPHVYALNGLTIKYEEVC